jgi:DNA polymerase-3 subunit delta'
MPPRRSAAELKEDITPVLHPKFGEHLVAHADTEKQLLAMAAANRLPHALLFTGPRGIGKATLAYRLARFLLAPRDTGASLFGESLPPESLHIPATHPTFRRMAAGSHPDVLVLEAEDIKVEEARSVAAFLSLTPAESEWRVVIIDSIDAMNRNAANALLKTLEEPPARAALILVSHNPGALLPTIRSRCRTLRVPPLNEAEFARVMATISPDLTPQQAQVWALLSGGSPGVALSLQQARADIVYRELLERASDFDMLKNHAFAERFARKDAAQDWQVLSRLFMWMMARIAAPAEGHEVYSGEHEALGRLQSGKTLDGWLDLWEKAGRLLADTEYLHLDKKQAILTLLRAAGE